MTSQDIRTLSEEFEALCKKLYDNYRADGLSPDQAADKVIDFLERLVDFTEHFGIARWDR